MPEVPAAVDAALAVVLARRRGTDRFRRAAFARVDPGHAAPCAGAGAGARPRSRRSSSCRRSRRRSRRCPCAPSWQRVAAAERRSRSRSPARSCPGRCRCTRRSRSRRRAEVPPQSTPVSPSSCTPSKQPLVRAGSRPAVIRRAARKAGRWCRCRLSPGQPPQPEVPPQSIPTSPSSIFPSWQASDAQEQIGAAEARSGNRCCARSSSRSGTTQRPPRPQMRARAVGAGAREQPRPVPQRMQLEVPPQSTSLSVPFVTPSMLQLRRLAGGGRAAADAALAVVGDRAARAVSRSARRSRAAAVGAGLSAVLDAVGAARLGAEAAAADVRARAVAVHRAAFSVGATRAARGAAAVDAALAAVLDPGPLQVGAFWQVCAPLAPLRSAAGAIAGHRAAHPDRAVPRQAPAAVDAGLVAVAQVIRAGRRGAGVADAGAAGAVARGGAGLAVGARPAGRGAAAVDVALALVLDAVAARGGRRRHDARQAAAGREPGAKVQARRIALGSTVLPRRRVRVDIV